MRGGDAHLTVEISDSVHVILGASQNEEFQIQYDSNGFQSRMNNLAWN